VAARSSRARLSVARYGGGRRGVGVVSGAGHRDESGPGLAPVLWVFVHGRTGTHRDEYSFTTDGAMAGQEVIEACVGRGNEETTFQEMRSCLGLEGTRGWEERTVPRAAPCRFGPCAVVACLYGQLPKRGAGERAVEGAGKAGAAFSDAITAVRRWLWRGWVVATPGYRPAFEKLARPFRALLVHALAPAA
jgi:hypothetical protein